MNVGSLFSGIGGIELAFEQTGFKTEWFIECDPYCQAILKKQFPNTKIYGDIKEIDFKAIQKVDILTGGFPCQDISNAGKRVGIEGNRSSLWKYYLKAISTIRPKIALIENVSAICSRGLSVVLCDLASIGYDAEWYSIPASAIGANHQRKRIFIIAYTKRFRLECSREQKSMGKEGRISEIKRSKLTSSIKELCNPRSNKARKRRNLAGNWIAKPRMGRVAHGISNRVDRTKCLGNAVVPQVAEVFAQAIKEVERGD